MNYNNQFEDLMDSINNFAKGIGFHNGVDWAESAQHKEEISYSDFRNYENCHILRIRMAHGNARDINVSQDTFKLANDFYNDITRSSLTKNKSNSKVHMPDGGFRARPYHKTFDFDGSDGNTYHFEFEIVYENNWICGSSYSGNDDGYFIHVLDAPYLDDALSDQHTFHIINSGGGQGYICWDEPIRSFEQANAVMFVWVKRYVALIVEQHKYDSDYSESNLLRRVNPNKVFLPGGTFRGGDRPNYYQHNKSRNKRNRDRYDRPNKVNLPEGTFRAIKNEDVAALYPELNKNKPVKPAKSIKPQTFRSAIRNVDKIYMSEDVYEQIMSILGTRKPELGGMLGFSSDDTTIDVFEFDDQGEVGPYEYNPNIEHLDEVINDEWMPKNIHVAGFVHSHPSNFNVLSSADVEYACRIMDVLDKDFLFMPVVTSSYAYKKEMNPYVIYRNGKVSKVALELYKQPEEELNVEEDITADLFDQATIDEIEARFDKMNSKPAEPKQAEVAKPAECKAEPDKDKPEGTFDRIETAVDLSYLKDCHVIGIGCGGSRGFFEDLVRCGVGKFTLIDGDRSSVTNIASQNGYISDVGHYKVRSLMRRMYDINDEIDINAVPKMLAYDIDNLLDYGVDLSKVDPKKTIICAFTDDFNAQKTAEELAFKYHIPYLSGQHHQYGNTSEVTYYYPGVTTYRVKDVLKTRYKMYESGYTNDVTSEGSLIFNTTRINALCEKLAIGMLLYGKYPNNRFSTFIERRCDRNLIVIRQIDLIGQESSLHGLFYDDDEFLFDDVVWVDPHQVWGEEAK